MRITEPITMLTDYAIALESLGFAIALWRMQGTGQRSTVRFWSLAFAATAIAAIVGGTCHGFVAYLPYPLTLTLWKTVVASLGLASSFMLLATGSRLAHPLKSWLYGAIGLKLALYLGWLATHVNFAIAVIDYLSAMGIVFILQLLAYSQGEPSASWIMAGVIVSGLAASVLLMQFAEQGLSANDVYHLIQLVALYLFYRGVCSLKVVKK